MSRNLSVGGFGTAGTPGATIGTEWPSEDIWLKKKINLSDLTPDELNRVVVRLSHDENVEAWIKVSGAAQRSRTCIKPDRALNGYDSILVDRKYVA